MAKRKSNVSTKKKFKWGGLFAWMSGAMGQSFAWILLVLFLVGGGMGVREMLYADAALKLKRVEVVPADALTMAQLEGLQKKYLSQNTAEIDLRAIARDLESDHGIMKADVRRQLPATLQIHVSRRVPFAYVHFGRSGKWAIVSRDAVVLDVVAQPAEGLYQVEDETLGNQKPKIGMRLNKSMMSLGNLLEAFRQHPAGQNEKVTSVTMLPNAAAWIHLGDLSLKLSLEDAALGSTFEKFQYLLETETRAVIEYVDLRFNRVILKRKTETQEKEAKKKR